MELFYRNDEVIEYTLERKRIKNCYISVKDGQVKVKVPIKISKPKIEEMLEKRSDWILEHVKKQSQNAQAPKKYVDGEIFKVLGKEAVLNISYEKIQKPKLRFLFRKLKVTLPEQYQENAKEQVQKMLEQFYDELAEKEVEKAMKKVTKKVGIEPNQYKVKKLKSTWGNCSTTKNISINKNVVMYSRNAIEYVCLHEICHLQNMDHSKNFWNMVEKYMPDYKKAEEELKEKLV